MQGGSSSQPCFFWSGWMDGYVDELLLKIHKIGKNYRRVGMAKNCKFTRHTCIYLCSWNAITTNQVECNYAVHQILTLTVRFRTFKYKGKFSAKRMYFDVTIPKCLLLFFIHKILQQIHWTSLSEFSMSTLRKVFEWWHGALMSVPKRMWNQMMFSKDQRTSFVMGKMQDRTGDEVLILPLCISFFVFNWLN